MDDDEIVIVILEEEAATHDLAQYFLSRAASIPAELRREIEAACVRMQALSADVRKLSAAIEALP